MRVLVTGGRDFDNESLLEAALDKLHEVYKFDVLIHGNAKGADFLADFWAKSNDINVISCPADWETYGYAAGTVRNKKMLVEHKPELVIAFSGGKGTANMVSIAEKAGVKIIKINEEKLFLN